MEQSFPGLYCGPANNINPVLRVLKVFYANSELPLDYDTSHPHTVTACPPRVDQPLLLSFPVRFHI